LFGSLPGAEEKIAPRLLQLVNQPAAFNSEKCSCKESPARNP
jgi:hypothetical protein